MNHCSKCGYIGPCDTCPTCVIPTEPRENLAARIHDLEILVMVYEATVYCMMPGFSQSPLARIMTSQVSACAEAHEETMGEASMFANLVPRYVPVDK